MSLASEPGASFVFRSSPHTVPFQDFSESNLELIEGLDPETACLVLYDVYVNSEIKIHPPPKSCVAIPRALITCPCGEHIFRRNTWFCDVCLRKNFDSTQKLMKQEEEDKARREKEKKDKAKGKKKAKDIEGKNYARPWRPPSPKAKKSKAKKK